MFAACLILACRSSTRQLKASGNVITHLVGSLDGRLFSNVVWRFTVRPDGAMQQQQQNLQEAGSPEELPELPELPYNRCTEALFTNTTSLRIVVTNGSSFRNQK